MDDIRDACPDTVRGLESLLQYGGDDVEDVFALTFEATAIGVDGKHETQDLVLNGSKLPVTSGNRQEYVDAYVRWLSYERASASVDAFRYGFKEVFSSTQALQLFRPKDLEAACVGTSDFDLHGLEEVTRYVGYTANSPQIKWFWETVHNLDTDARKALLKFLTSTDRAPFRGLAKDGSLIIQRTAELEHLPVAHTCHNILDLPEYETREVLERKLLQSMELGHVGFGLI